MDLFGIEPSDDRVIVRVNGSAIGDDEIAIDAEGYREADDIYRRDSLHIASHRYLVGQVLRVPVEFKGVDAGIAEFLREKWIEKQTPKIMSEGYKLGLAPVELQIDRDSKLPIPHVYQHGLGPRYKITSRERRRRRAVQYRFYHVGRELGERGQIRRSHKVIVYDGFDADPDPNTGALTSVVASLAAKYREHEENYRIARVALANMARPMILLQTTRVSQGMDSIRPELSAPLYGGQDWLSEDRRERISAAAIDNDVLTRQQREFWKNYYDQIDEQARSGSASVHQAHLNMIPMPADHKSAGYQTASMRTDWKAFEEIYEDKVTSAYGLQRAHLQSGLGRLQISENLTNAALVNAVNLWRVGLSRVFTDLYRRAFGGEGEIVFPREVNDTQEGLYEKWAQGLLTWEGLKELTHAMTGIDPRFMRDEEPRRPDEIAAAAASAAAKPAQKKRKIEKKKGT